MKKILSFFGCFLPIIVALVCQVMVSLAGSIVYGFVIAARMVSLGITDAAEQEAFLLEQTTSPDALMLITAAATLVTLVVGVLWYRSCKPKAELGLKEIVNPKLLAAMLCLGLSLQFLISLCLNAVYPILPQTLTEEYGSLMETLIGGNVWLSLFVTVILAPVAEELLFRGITMKKAQKIMPFLAANVLQAVLFGIYHLNWIQGVYAFVLGMILGFTAEYFHSIWASIILHAFVNGSAEILSALPEAVTGTWAGIVGIALVGVVLLFVAAKLYPRARTEQVSEKNPEENEKFTENSFDE